MKIKDNAENRTLFEGRIKEFQIHTDGNFLIIDDDEIIKDIQKIKDDIKK